MIDRKGGHPPLAALLLATARTFTFFEFVFALYERKNKFKKKIKYRCKPIIPPVPNAGSNAIDIRKSHVIMAASPVSTTKYPTAGTAETKEYKQWIVMARPPDSLGAPFCAPH